MKAAFAFLFAAIALPASAQPQDPRLQPTADYQRCLETGDAAEGKTSAIDVCIGLELDRQEKRLKDVFYETSDEHGWKWQDYIRDQQAIWRRESSERCSAKVPASPTSTLTSRAFNQCMIGEILGQIVWLESLPPE